MYAFMCATDPTPRGRPSLICSLTCVESQKAPTWTDLAETIPLSMYMSDFLNHLEYRRTMCPKHHRRLYPRPRFAPGPTPRGRAARGRALEQSSDFALLWLMALRVTYTLQLTVTPARLTGKEGAA